MGGVRGMRDGYFHVIGLETSTEFGIIVRAAEAVMHMDYAKCWHARNVQ